MTIHGIRGALGVNAYALRSSQLERTSPSRARMNLEDKVTISTAARQQALPARLRGLSIQAHANPALAEQLARDYAYTEQTAKIDLTDRVAGAGPERYVATGEPVTVETQARVKQQAEDLRAATATLYESEQDKGTAASDIFDKLLSLISAQPADFRDAINWEGVQP